MPTFYAKNSNGTAYTNTYDFSTVVTGLAVTQIQRADGVYTTAFGLTSSTVNVGGTNVTRIQFSFGPFVNPNTDPDGTPNLMFPSGDYQLKFSGSPTPADLTANIQEFAP